MYTKWFLSHKKKTQNERNEIKLKKEERQNKKKKIDTLKWFSQISVYIFSSYHQSCVVTDEQSN